MDFGTVIWIVVVVVAPLAAIVFAGAFGALDQLGRGGLFVDDRPPRTGLVPNSAAALAEREAEIRQLVQARSDRRRTRGEAGLDVEREVTRLLELDPSAQPEADQQDAALRAEVRQLVIARNDRRAARGQPPLDVEAEVERQLRDIA
jgi:hypothetical protein